MDPERWQRIADLYELARAREPENRSAFLREACGEDEDLQQEVESLLRQDISGDGVLERIAERVRFPDVVDGSVSVLSPNSPDSLFGRSFGAYELKALLGMGGMGEVYRAFDVKLRRDVALKVLPKPLASDPERLARFRREAQLLASLKHKNIAAIYGFEETPDANFLVLELVEGETLAERI